MIAAVLAASVALSLPPGHGNATLYPLPVASEPAGATASVRYRDSHGLEGSMSCTTPCTLMIPRGSPIILDVVKDGQPFAKTPVTWGFKGLSGPNLYPSTVAASLPAAQP